jgi:hypothetical protein
MTQKGTTRFSCGPEKIQPLDISILLKHELYPKVAPATL